MISAMNLTPIQREWVGRVIDERFTLLQWLGGSGQCGVFLTQLPGAPSQKAALKLIPDQADSEDRIAGFAAAAKLSHPHLMRLFDAGRCKIDGATFVYVVTEFADEILAEILPTRALTPDEVKEMLPPVLDALSYIHGQGLVHVRLKPSNILVVNDQLKLSVDSLQPTNESDNAIPALSIYDAPERAAGTLSPATDLWSLGITVVEALTQHPPDWNRASNRDPRIPASIPQPLAGISASCLHVNPANRSTLGDIKRRLSLAASPLPTPRTAARIEAKATSKPRPAVLVVAALVLIAVIALLWSRSHQPQTTPEPAQQQPAATEPQSQAPAASPQPQQQQPTAEPASPPVPVTATESSNAAKGSIAQRVMPDLLPAASRSIQGKVNVRVRLNVDPAGEVSSADFESAGPSRYFAKAAMDAARQWKFKPAQANGRPVPSVWILDFQFTRDATDVTPVETTP